jgi:hypothetical protein
VRLSRARNGGIVFVSDLSSSPDAQSSGSKFWFVISASANLIGIGTFIVLVIGFLIYYFTEIPILGPVLIAFALGVFLVLMIGRLMVSGAEPMLSLGSFSDYAVVPSVTRSRPQQPPQPKPNIVSLAQRQFVKLKGYPHPNNSFIETKDSDGADGIVARFRNEPEGSVEVTKVRGRILYFNTAGDELGSVSHGVWLNERYNYTSFGVGTERALIVGVLVESQRVPARQGQPSRFVTTRLQGLTMITDHREGETRPSRKPTWVTINCKHMFIRVTLYSDAGVIRDFWFEFISGQSPAFRSMEAPFQTDF